MSSNPYATPKAAVADEPVPQGEYIPGGRNVPASHGWSWIADGWTLFKASPGLWIGVVVVLFIILFAMAMVPFVGPIAQSLLTPVFMGGLVLGCRAIEDGSGMQFSHLFEGFKTRFGTLVSVGALYLAGFIAIMVVVMLIFGAGMAALFVGGGQPDTAQAGAALGVVLAVLVAIALSLPLVMAVWFAAPLVVFHNLGAVEAMKASFTGCLRNIVPFLVYGIIGFVLMIVASIPIGLGWLVLGPVIAASVYTAYRDIYLR